MQKPVLPIHLRLVMSASRSDASRTEKQTSQSGRALNHQRKTRCLPRKTPSSRSRGLERGQGDGKATPSPNFCVLMDLFKETQMLWSGFYTCISLGNPFPWASRTALERLQHQVLPSQACSAYIWKSSAAPPFSCNSFLPLQHSKMSGTMKAYPLSRVEDLTLGSFAFVPTSATLDHLVRFLSTWSGSECVSTCPMSGIYTHLQILLPSAVSCSRLARYAECLVKCPLHRVTGIAVHH